MAGAPVVWFSKKQTVVAQSSCEAEYVALSELVREFLWLKHLLTELTIPFELPFLAYVDNKAARELRILSDTIDQKTLTSSFILYLKLSKTITF